MNLVLSSAPGVRPATRAWRGRGAWIALGLLIALAVFAPWLGTSDPVLMHVGQRLQAPSAHAWFGTDAYGRDVYSRVLYGMRTSLVVAAAVVAIALSAGVAVGLFAGYWRALDGPLMRMMDGLMAIPGLVLAISLIAIIGAGVPVLVIAIAIPEVPRLARVVRAVTMSVRAQPYIDAAVLAGNSTPRLLWRHVLPATLGPLCVALSYAACHAIMVEAALSFLGAGLPSEMASLGNVIAEGRRYLQIRPGLTLIPGVTLTLVILVLHGVGESVRRRADPRGEGRV